MQGRDLMRSVGGPDVGRALPCGRVVGYGSHLVTFAAQWNGRNSVKCSK